MYIINIFIYLVIFIIIIIITNLNILLQCIYNYFPTHYSTVLFEVLFIFKYLLI